MATLEHCGKCGMTTAHVNDECQRCAFRKAHPKSGRKPMDEAAKERLKAANERRKKERDARRRDEHTTTKETN